MIITVDVSISYSVSGEELRKKYRYWDKLDEDEKIDKAIEYVKKHLFDVNDLMFQWADVD